MPSKLTPTPHTTTQAMTDDKVLLVDNFAISIWFSLLFAVSFSGAIFGLFGVSAALAMFLIGFASSLVTLWMAYHVRHEKNAHKIYADALAIAGLIIFVVTIIEANLVIALVEMLFFLQLALNLYFREHRQIYFGLITCFVALMTGAIYTYQATYLLFILLFCLCGCFYLALSYVDKQLGLSQQIDSPTTGSGTDTSPLSLPRRRLRGHWHNLERLTVAALICMVAGVIYLLMPRFPAGNLGKLPLEGWGKYQHSHFKKQLLPENADLSDKFYKTPRDDQVASNGNQAEENPTQHSDKSGNSERTDASPTQAENTASHTDSDDTDLTGSKAQYLRDDSIYFYVKSGRSRYLQVDVKTYFDGASWYALQYGRKRLLEDKKLFWLYAGKPNASIDISVVKDTPEHIVTTDNALAVSFPSKHLGRDYYDNLKASAMLKAGTFYQLHVLDEYKQNRLIDRHQAKPDFRDSQLPSNLDPRVAELAKQLTQDAKTDWQKASILEQHLRQNYQYTLSTLWNQNNVPLSDFLFGKQTGHCEYFATAMAMMLRTQGIPARMVHGFVAEDFNPITGYYEVKGTNGHAWVAAYVDGIWTTFEPTGAYQPPQQHPSGNSPQQAGNPPANNQNETAHQQLKDYLENLAQQEDRLSDTEQKKTKTVTSYLRDFWYSLLVLLEQLWQGIITLVSYLWFLLILTPLLWCVWRFWHRQYLTDWQDKQDLQRIKRHPEQSPQTDIKHYMSCIQRMLARQGIQRMRGATVDSFAQRLVSEQLISANTADMLKTLVNQYFYHHQQHAAAPITAKTTAATAPETEPQQPSKPNDTTLKPFFVALFTECKATREGKRQNH